MYKKIDKSGNIYVAETFRTGSKTSSRTVCKLGTVSDLMEKNNWTREQVIGWVDEEIKRMTAEAKEQTGDVILRLSKSRRIPKDRLRSIRVGYLFLQSVYSSLGIPKILDKISQEHQFHYSLNDVFSCLVFNRVLEPASKRKSFLLKEDYPEEWNFTQSDIYRALSVLGEHSGEIQKQIFRNSRKVMKRNTSVLYYDCSNFYFEIEQADESKFRSYGKSKENRPNPIVQMGLFMDTDGIPLRMSVFPGSQNEQMSIDKSVIREICRDYEVGKFVYCADAGLGSSKIKKALNGFAFPCAYIVTQSIKKLPKADKDWSLDEKHEDYWYFRKYDPKREKTVTYKIRFEDILQDPKNTTIYYREKWHMNNNGDPERLIVTYSPKYADFLRRKRNEQIDRAIKKVETNGKRKGANDPTRFLKETHITKEGEVAESVCYEIDQAKVAEEARYDGFYALVTDLEDDIDTILGVSRQRWMIETGFREMKTCLDARPVYVRREDRIQAHFLVCFVALMLVQILKKALPTHYTTDEILETLRKMRLHVLGNVGYDPDFTRTDLTDALTETFDLPLDEEYISDLRLKQLINRTKKKRKIST